MDLSPIDYLLWALGFSAEVAVVVCSIRRRNFIRYLPLNLYVGFTAVVSLGEFYCLRKFGFSSFEYSYFYYYSDMILTILLFFVIMQFYEHVFSEMQVGKHISGFATALLAGTAGFSYMVIAQHRDHLTMRFVVEVSRNLYFVGVVLTYILWGAVLKLRETRAHLVQLILALGVFFSASAATYALRNLFPGLEPSVLKWMPPLVAIWLPAAWAFTFSKVSEDARLETAQLLARAR
ncbi:MAG TPA: hypothetical protein VEJ39_07760 [Candidatus Acidoferrales bacterium]|nr:hypothetical protein [Candidatus Acidoferrales bacterium]